LGPDLERVDGYFRAIFLDLHKRIRGIREDKTMRVGVKMMAGGTFRTLRGVPVGGSLGGVILGRGGKKGKALAE